MRSISLRFAAHFASGIQSCWAALFVAALVSSPVHAQAPLPSPIAKTELLINAPAVHADEVIWAGVTFTLPDHWHIYWQNPGDSGIPTTFAWTLPEGISAGDITWPAPERIDTSGIITYGYSHRVTLPVALTPSHDGIHGPVSVTAKWLACDENQCIPESATLSATLPAASVDAAKTLGDAVMRAPQMVVNGKMEYATVGDKVLLGVTGDDMLPAGAPAVTNAQFFPLDDGIITNADAQTFKLNPQGNSLTLTMTRGALDLLPVWHGVLALTRGDVTRSYAVRAKLETGAAGSAASSTAVSPSRATANVTLLAALALAFVGGLILNVMPCVLPILALKALALAKKAQASRAAAARQGIAYTAGVVLSFLAIAGGMLALKASGAAIGWGFQLQHSGFVLFLLVVMLLVSANLLGLFPLPVLFGNRTTITDDSSVRGSLLTGALAVLVATPCTAPFMATAIGATLTFPTVQALLVFAALGLGMAAPFLIISLWPAARRLLPKPGKWMQQLKHLLALPMLATAAWLAWVLVQLHSGPMTLDASHTAYSPTALQSLRDQGKPVLVDATAAWCLSCKVNEHAALRPDQMQQFFREKNVTLMVADWTSSDATITAYLASFGRNGVPLYVYYPPHAAPVVLPQILTPGSVREAIAGVHE